MTLSGVRDDGVNSPIRVVIIDDTDDIRMLLRMQIEMEDGIEVVAEGTDGTEAAELAVVAEPDVIVMDMMMPGMTGIDALPFVKAANPHSRVVIYSSRAATETETLALAAGADAYVEKHAPHGAVVEAIRRLAAG